MYKLFMERFKKVNIKICLIICLIIFMIFCIINYNFSKSGNNNHKKFENRTINEIVNLVQNYYAEIELETMSNKTVNTYFAKEYFTDCESRFESLDGKLVIENRDGKIVIFNGENINNKEYKIENKLNNNLFLVVAIKEIEELCSENESKVKVETENKIEKISYTNTYGVRKELYYDSKNKLFEKMNIIHDVQNINVCIRYKYIEFK